MTKRIFRGIFYVSALTLIACILFVFSVMYTRYENSKKAALESTAEIISSGIEKYGADYLDSIKNIKERVTLIDNGGKVLYDNQANASEMENHAGRKEVSEAFKNGTGSAIRTSGTLTAKTAYYAVLLRDGRVLRVADSHYSVIAVLVTLAQPIAAATLIMILLAAILASFISKKITEPINKISLDRPEIEESYDELAPLIKKINAQNRRINSQIARLTRSKHEFEIIADNMSEGLLLTDRDLHILTHNRSMKHFFGTNDDIDGQNVLTLNRSEGFREVIASVGDGNHGTAEINIGESVYEIIGNPVYDENNDAAGAVFLVVDVTEREKRETLRREFTANVSHELKTPLTSIYGISDMLKSGMVKPEDISGFAEDINKESARLITLVNDIIRLSQLDDDNSHSDDTDVDLYALAVDAADRLKTVAAAKNVKIELLGENASVCGNQGYLFEMIYNLLDNAVKYNKESGSVSISVTRDNDTAVVAVTDTGIGIDREHLGRVFERFYRVDKSRSKNIGGTGLGLSIVKHIAQYHGGTVGIDSTLGKGTVITARLPESRIN